jgi:PKD repeat protein
MTNMPKPSEFPNSLDTDKNLFLVHDALRVRLLEDYKPGDTSILVEGDYDIIKKFPPTGVITLTEQCSDIDKRALSFYYNSRTPTSFNEMELLPEFIGLEISKPKKITNVTMNVLNLHHNYLKDALVEIEKFVGTKYSPSETSITARINFLNELVLSPKAWFTVDSAIGKLNPSFKARFNDESVRLGDGPFKHTWDFGDGSNPLEIASQTMEEYASREQVISGVEVSGKKITKSYSLPGIYTVKLTIENQYGEDEVVFEKLINVKNDAPEEAVIKIIPRASQNYRQGDLSNGIYPKIRSIANAFVNIEVPDGENLDNPGYTYGGELLGTPMDTIEEYTWSLGDDLPHTNSNVARASYSLGGYYDIILRVDTKYGSYRITQYKDSVDIIESKNLWLFNFKVLNSNGSGTLQAYEFALGSETFKTLGNQTLSLNRSDSFLSQSPLSYGNTSSNGIENDNAPYFEGTYSKAKKEFRRNVEFTLAGTSSSGNKGNSLLMWASGGSVLDDKNINIKKYNAFDDHYDSVNSITNRPWNWAALNSQDRTYFIFGQGSATTPGQNQTFAQRLDYDILSQSASAPVDLTTASFENGADELLDHPAYFDDNEVATNGYFAVYRTAWKDSIGYILRNSSVNEFFRISDFYKTKGTVSDPYGTITKLPDMIGSVKLEGQLVALNNGIFMFNNSGEICAWNDTSLTWEVGRANSSSLSFRSVQDTEKSNFDDKSNTLLAASDGDRIAYLSYDYSEKAMIKFNGTDLTFSMAKTRPYGAQFKMGVY